jgi:hypothetical protein
MDFSNKVKIAVDRAGGPTKVALQMGCSGSAVFAWIRKREVSDIDKAKKLAEIAGMDLREIRPCR